MSAPSFRVAPPAFTAGGVVLFIEIAGAKLLAPVFGSSLYVWAALITTTLLSIAVGAWIGGWAADLWPTPRTLSLLWLGAALFLGASVPLRSFFFPLADGLGLETGVFLTAIFLFMPSLTFLSAIPPLLIRLLNPTPEKLGKAAGQVSALGTAGSCFGALFTAFFLIPRYPLNYLFLGAAGLLTLPAFAFFWKPGKKIQLSCLILVWIALLALFSPQKNPSFLGKDDSVAVRETRQSLYGQLQVLDRGAERFLFIDGIFQGGMVLPTRSSLDAYVPAMELLGFSADPEAKKILVIGLGAGILPAQLEAKGLNVETVEINPQMEDLCAKWFGFSPRSEKIHLEDGRRFLRKSLGRYDLVYLDAFSGEEVPSQLLTQEAFREIKSRLSSSGALVVNYVANSQPSSSRVLATIAATLRTVYPSVELFTDEKTDALTNYFLVARIQTGSWVKVPDISWDDGKTLSFGEMMENRIQSAEPYPFLLTDNYCPLDWLDRAARAQWRKDCMKIMDWS